MLAILLSWLWIQYQSRHSVLAILMSWFWVQSVIYQWLNQTVCGSYFIELIIGSISNIPVIKADTVCYIFYWVSYGFNRQYTINSIKQFWLSILMSLFRVYSLTDQWIIQTLRVRCFTELIMGSISNWPVKNKTLFVSYFIKMILGSISNLPVIKSDTL